MRSRARQWSRSAWALAALFASLPVAGRLLLGTWGFEGSTALACLCLILGTYLHFVARRSAPALSDPAAMLDEAMQRVAAGQTKQAMRMLTRAIRLSPRFWQALQWRGQLFLAMGDSDAALADLSGAIAIAPGEPQLYNLRGRAFAAAGDQEAAQRDYQTAAVLAGRVSPG
jgi:Flp pilus assembly protein TadD